MYTVSIYIWVSDMNLSDTNEDKKDEYVSLTALENLAILKRIVNKEAQAICEWWATSKQMLIVNLK